MSEVEQGSPRGGARLAALERLTAGARGLPGDKAAAGLPRALSPEPADVALEPDELRREVGALLTRLAARLDAEIPRALELAEKAWDQVDSIVVVDAPLGAALDRLRRAARALATDPDPARRASGLTAQLTLDAAAGLAALLERRMSTLVRLRLRAPDGALFDDRGRPFLDAAAALTEVARQWT